jgi:hypothetical protein
MLNIRGITVVLALSLSGLASAEVIIADPSTFAAGTDVTHAYEGASLYTADSYSDGTITYESVLVNDCIGCKPAVNGARVFTQADGHNRFDYESTFAYSLRNENAPGSDGKVLLVDFDNQTNFVQIVGSQGNGFTSFMVDIWDDAGNWLGNCSNGQATGKCSSKILSVPPNGSETQGYLPIWELSFVSDIANIGFITAGGSSGPGYVTSVAYSIPEPAPIVLLALGVAGLLIGRRKSSSFQA